MPQARRTRAQRDEQFLVPAVRADVVFQAMLRLGRRRSPRRASNAPLGACDIGHLVEVVGVVLVRQPLRRQLRDLHLIVAGDQQRHRIEREPAGGHVVRHDAPHCLGRFLPEGRQVQPLDAQLGDPVVRALECVPAHECRVRQLARACNYHAVWHIDTCRREVNTAAAARDSLLQHGFRAAPCPATTCSNPDANPEDCCTFAERPSVAKSSSAASGPVEGRRWRIDAREFLTSHERGARPRTTGCTTRGAEELWYSIHDALTSTCRYVD